MVGTPAVQALERVVFFFFFFRVGLRLKKVEQKVQSSHIYPFPQTMSPVINILH